MELAQYDAEAARARRDQLREALHGAPALIPAGAPVGRNYPANPYPFRASSHFLYLVGLPLEGAFLLLGEEGATLFVPEAPEDDALWHGPRPGPAELAAATGAVVRPRSELASLLAGRGVATIPATDLGTRALQSELLGRPVV